MFWHALKGFWNLFQICNLSRSQRGRLCEYKKKIWSRNNEITPHFLVNIVAAWERVVYWKTVHLNLSSTTTACHMFVHSTRLRPEWFSLQCRMKSTWLAFAPAQQAERVDQNRTKANRHFLTSYRIESWIYTLCKDRPPCLIGRWPHYRPTYLEAGWVNYLRLISQRFLYAHLMILKANIKRGKKK